MKLLVIVKDYPMHDFVGAMFVHTRCKHYQEKGIDVTVISGICKEPYILDGISVFNVTYYENHLRQEKFDLLISHAPVLDFDVPFIQKYGDDFSKFVFVFHGQEVLFRRFVYSKPFPYLRQKFAKVLIEDCYNIVKLHRMHIFLKSVKEKAEFVFVSKWMKDEFVRWVRFDPEKFGKSHIIHNCIGQEFETECYNTECHKEFDFLSIRSCFDGSKYCVDIICDLAMRYPQYRFLLIGKGNYFDHYHKPDNLTVRYALLNHTEVMSACNEAKCALMPTRTDAQGVMACEIATFGMPMLTSDIKVMKEIFCDFNNVLLVPNNARKIDLQKSYALTQNQKNASRNEKYFKKNTSFQELELFKEIING